MITKLAVLKAMRFGQRIAEEEADQLEGYFVETNQWNEIYNGEKDLVFGPKGAGKSALYALLRKRSDTLLQRNIKVVLAENPTGATVFRGLVVDPPPTEIAFVALWKLYCITLMAQIIRDEKIPGDEASALVSTLQNVGLLPVAITRETLFSRVSKAVHKWFDTKINSVEGGLAVDPTTGYPSVTGKIIFASGSVDQRDSQLPIEDYLGIADNILASTNF